MTDHPPENRETPLGEVQSWVTPNRLFFVRNHFDEPKIDLASWRLQIGGRVQREIALTWEQLDTLPQRSVFATVECAGNGRSFLKTPVKGVQWGAGAVGHAEWTGVPLHVLLEEARPHDDVIEIIAEGADGGTEPGEPSAMAFARGLPLEKALHPDTILALRMNGEVLEPCHGYPARLLVPGWYGVASVKWLQRIEAWNRPFEGYFQTVMYTIQRRTGRGVVKEVVGAMPVKSEIIRPREGEELRQGTNRILGLAWAGEESVAAVEVSVDGGENWRRAALSGPAAPYSWTLWEFPWEASAAGEHTLLARAVAAGGETQPLAHDPLREGYLINFSRPIRVRVSAARRSPGFTGSRLTLEEEMRAHAEARARLRLDVEMEMELTHGSGI